MAMDWGAVASGVANITSSFISADAQKKQTAAAQNTAQMQMQMQREASQAQLALVRNILIGGGIITAGIIVASIVRAKDD